MVPLMRVAATVVVLAVGLAAPAAANEDEYLNDLQDRYAFLTAEQLVSEGYRVCALTKAGVIAPDVVTMVVKDLDIANGAAMDIVSRARANLC